MTSQQQDFEMVAGDSKKIKVPDGVRDDDTDEIIDLTNVQEVEWRLLDKYGDTTLVEKDNNSGSDVKVTDATAGLLEVMVRPEDTRGEEGRYQHRLRITDADGMVSTVSMGEVQII